MPMSFQKKFEELLVSSDFDQLPLYTNPNLWECMTKDERELLGILLVKQGEHQLKNGDSKVLESFQMASKVAPTSPVVFFKQGLVYASQEMNIRCLIAAGEVLEKAITLDPAFINAWHAWGNVLVRIGVFYQEYSYLQQADDKFSHVEKICASTGYHPSEKFYWHWGVCCFCQGKQSGEASDFFNGLAKFKQALQAGCESPDFYIDYGRLLIELASLIGRKELVYEAVNFYVKSVRLTPDRYEGWFNLACTYQHIHDLYGNKDYFHLANESFCKAADLHPEAANLWFQWGELYRSQGKIEKNIDHFRISCEKFEKVNALEPDFPHLLLRWGEVQMLLASETENFNQLQGAKTKIAKSLEICPDDPYAWYVYGTCLNEFGNYFEDEEYYLQAIEKFQYGLSLNQSHPLLWHGLALAHFAIGELHSDVSMIEKSVRFYSRIAEFGGQEIHEFWNDWGVALLRLGEMTNEKKYVESALEKFEQAMVHREETIDGDSFDLECLYNYGCAWDFLGDLTEEGSHYEKSIQILSYVIQQDPDYSHARYNLALALSHLGELNADIDCFHKAITLFQELVHEDSEDEAAWNDWGQILLNLAFLTHDPHYSEYSQKLYEQAEQKLLHSVALGSLQAFYNLACLYSLTGNYTASMHYLERAQISHTLPSLEDVMHDEWLDGLKSTHGFRHFISYLASQQEKDK